MKVCAISPLSSASKEEILDFIGTCEYDLVVLPGNSKNHPSHTCVSKVLKPGVLAFVEDGKEKGNSIPWLVSSSTNISMPPQIFVTNPTAGELDELQSVWEKRTHQINGRSCSFAICGEIDGFDKNGSVKKGRYLPYDVLINPTHTTRGRWNHLGVKLKALSSETIVVHVANNDYNHLKVTTHLRIYKNGEIMKCFNVGKITWSECEI